MSFNSIQVEFTIYSISKVLDWIYPDYGRVNKIFWFIEFIFYYINAKFLEKEYKQKF
jgi:hypothetical protein